MIATKELSTNGEKAVGDIASRHGFSVEAARHMLDALIAGNGSMAQFSHPEFSGSGQWMRGGMTMISDMFNADLKGWINALCLDLSNLVVREPALFRARAPVAPRDAAPFATDSRRSSMPRSGDWWPGGMGHPNSAGSQNGMRYAYFARAQRLAIERNGVVTLYDTSGHEINGVSQQQSTSGSIRFASQRGSVDLASLPVVAG